MSIVVLKWINRVVTALDQLVANAEPNRPFGGSTLTNKIAGESSDSSNAKAVTWEGAPVTELSDVSPGNDTAALAFSSDETVVAGYYDNVAFGVFSPVVWVSGSPTALPPFAGFDFALGPGSVAFPGGSNNLVILSDDGTIVPGTSQSLAGASQATLWTNASPALLPFPTGLTTGSIANAMDTLGVTILGQVWASDPTTAVACFWYSGACFPLVGLPTANVAGYAWACLDGTTSSAGAIWGYILGPLGNPNIGPCYWDSLTTSVTSGGITFYGVAHSMDRLAGGGPGVINGVSGALVSGLPVAVGQAPDASSNLWAVRWDGTTITNLGTLPGGSESSATDVSDDGSVVCGWAFDAGGVEWPVYWDASNVIHKLPTVADPSDFFQGEALGVSPDATLIWGDGDAPSPPSPPPPSPPSPPAPAPFIPAKLCGWRGLSGINWNGLAIIGDKFTNVIGVADFDTFQEYTNGMRMRVTSPPIQEDRKRIFISRVEIEVQAGEGLPTNPTVGPTMVLSYSRDGGMTFVPLRQSRSMGAVGEYKKRLRWINVGQARQWVFAFEYSDAARPAIIGAYADFLRGLG